MDGWLGVVIVVVGVLALLWAAALAALWLARPKGDGAKSLLVESARLLPDLLRLIGRLARDRTLPRGLRVRLWLLLGYLALPIDLVPDFVPVLGYADDVIVVALTLRAVVRRAGPGALARHWPGSATGLAAVRRLAGVPAEPAGSR